MTRDTRIVALTLVGIAGAIVLAALLCTFAIAQGASPHWRLPFRLLCHGMSERALTPFGEAMPICARCVGIYAGVLAGIAAFALRPSIGERASRTVLLVAALPIAVDGPTQAARLRLGTNPLRLATGLVAASAFAAWALAAVQHRRATAVTNS